MTVGVQTRREQASSVLNDPKFRGLVYQGLLLIAVIAMFWWLGSNAAGNLARQNKSTGFSFLDSAAGFEIGFTLLPYSRASSYFQVFLVGITNTLLVAAIGIVLATIWGFLLGIARLSNNFLIRTGATIYVEIVRNTPLLLQLFFWYFLSLNALPSVRQSIVFGDVVLNQRGLSLPVPIFDERFIWVAAVAVLTIVGAFVWRRMALRRIEQTGKRHPIWLPIAAAVIIPTVLVFFLSGTQVAFDAPALQGFNYQGGFTAPPELTALTLGLVIYTSAFIAEIVRAGIQSVNYGQTEAAEALGLKDVDRLRLVIIPQAMRVIIPPLTSQYLNLTKNSSLGAAIGFPELVSVFAGTALNQSGRAVEIIGMTMLVYLVISLLTSIFMNWYNARVALVQR